MFRALRDWYYWWSEFRHRVLVKQIARTSAGYTDGSNFNYYVKCGTIRLTDTYFVTDCISSDVYIRMKYHDNPFYSRLMNFSYQEVRQAVELYVKRTSDDTNLVNEDFL